ncbi:MAG: hypothetical protein CUN56_09815 [Phototrophicales bacterium]|nr:MAG: hypothetical protein CUN56_09815 [Phototrophicales bacterium]RMG71415.1 MAG: hypothetical protein D6711_15405 [Chloroflexota bacterium]
MTARSPYPTRPPILSVKVEDTMDIMIARDTARRAATLLGFTSARRAQLASATAALAELVLKTGDLHEIRLNGVIDGVKIGLQISVVTPWLTGVSANNVLVALRSKIGELVDDILFLGDEDPTIFLLMWLHDVHYDENEV